MPRPKAANEGIDCLDLHLLRSPLKAPYTGVSSRPPAGNSLPRPN
jgi:hypothetical protein